MAKTIKITEGGSERTFTTSKLKTTLQAGGTCEWIPYDERLNYVNIGSKIVNYSGTYNAADDNLDGYSQFTVDVQGGYDEDMIYGEINNMTFGA